MRLEKISASYPLSHLGEDCPCDAGAPLARVRWSRCVRGYAYACREKAASCALPGRYPRTTETIARAEAAHYEDELTHQEAQPKRNALAAINTGGTNDFRERPAGASGGFRGSGHARVRPGPHGFGVGIAIASPARTASGRAGCFAPWRLLAASAIPATANALCYAYAPATSAMYGAYARTLSLSRLTVGRLVDVVRQLPKAVRPDRAAECARAARACDGLDCGPSRRLAAPIACRRPEGLQAAPS